MFLNRRRALLLKNIYSQPYNIYWHLTGGKCSNLKDSYTIETSDFIFPTPTRDPLKFLGWTEGNNNNYINNLPFGSTGDKNLYAHWEFPLTASDISSQVNLNTTTIEVGEDLNKDGVYDNISLSLVGASGMEKLNLPLNNLIPNQRYILSFTESNNAKIPENTGAGYGTSAYGTFIVNSKNQSVSSDNKELSRSQGGLIVEGLGANGNFAIYYNSNLNGPRDMNIDFIASNSTMYWVWDFGSWVDHILYTTQLKNILLWPIPPEICFNQIKLKHPSNASPTIKIISVENDENIKFTYQFDGDSGCEAAYIPITGLAKNAKYTLNFSHKLNGKYINNIGGTYDYGCGIMTQENLNNYKLTGLISNAGTWLSNTWRTDKLDTVENITLTFTAPSDTVYLVWHLGNVSDGTIATINIGVIDLKLSFNDSSIDFI